jgi:hypothetical protein
VTQVVQREARVTRQDLEELEKSLMKDLVHRRQLGGYDTNAEAILALYEALFKIVSHLREKTPRK